MVMRFMRLLACMAICTVVNALEARPPDQFEPRRKGPFTAHEQEILKRIEGKVCQRQLPNDILISKPDFVVFVPEQSIFREKIDLKKPSDTYNDHFQVMYDERRKLMYAFWTQACTEAGPDQHISFAKSADKGRTWTNPVILAGGEYKVRPRLAASWQQPMLSRSGRLYCLWNQQVTSIGPHMGNMFGMYSDDAGETWSPVKQVKFGFRSDMDPKDPVEPPCWCNWQRPLRLGEKGRYFVGCSRDGQAPYDSHRCTRVDFWQFENIDADPEVNDIRITCLTPDRAALGVEDIDEPDLGLFGVGDKTRWQTVAEAAPVKLPDGRLFALCRSSTGYPLWTVSADGGRTWSKLKALRDRKGKPFLHPCSPGPLYDWKGCEAASGFYFALIHNTFDFNGKNSYQTRGPLYLLAGRYAPNAAQPIQFDDPRLFTPREDANSFYASYTVVDGEGVLWYNDEKYYLLGRKIGPEWFRTPSEFVLADKATKTACAIRLPERPSAAVRYAAEELRDYTEKMTGLRPTIVTRTDPAVQTVELSAVEDDPLLKTDGFHLKALGNRLIVRGSSTRGILYGVYELLETHGGCGFFSSTCETVPERTAFTVRGDLDEVHRPAFDLRDPFACDANLHPEFAAKIRKNATFGDHGVSDPKYGGVAYAFSKELFTHTFAKLVPVETYWKEHPEYFSEVNGRRIREQTQLCLTNPDVLAIAASNLLACVAREPNAWCYAVSHNDCANYCTCAKCRAVIDEEGSPAGPELRFCNRLAEILEKSHPGRRVKFSAYWYTRRPPKKTKPRHNVVVDLCPFECDFARPLPQSRYAENVAFCKDLGEWARLTSNIYLFDYIASFAQYHCPFPNVRSLRDNVRFYRQHGIRKYTAEGVYNSAHGDFAELKTWLLAKWMWNPDLDEEALLDRFFTGYYGAAAPFVRDYFEALHALPRNTEKDPLTISANTHDLGLTDAFLERALASWDAAERAVGDDPVRLRNVRAGKSSVVTAILQLKAAGIAVTREPYPSPKLRGLAAWMLAFLDGTKGPFVFSEFGAQDDMLKTRWKKIADPSFAVPARAKAVVEAEEVFSIAPNYGASLESDARASGGQAIRLPNVLSGEWIVSMGMGNLAFDVHARYRYRLRVRAEKKVKARGEGEQGKNLFLSAVSRTNCSRDCPAMEPVADYHWYEIGEWMPQIGQTLFVAPGRYDRKRFAANPAGETLWIDQIEIERIAEGGR